MLFSGIGSTSAGLISGADRSRILFFGYQNTDCDAGAYCKKMTPGSCQCNNKEHYSDCITSNRTDLFHKAYVSTKNQHTIKTHFTLPVMLLQNSSHIHYLFVYLHQSCEELPQIQHHFCNIRNFLHFFCIKYYKYAHKNGNRQDNKRVFY